MNRRSFIKASAALSTGVASLAGCGEDELPLKNEQLSNWAGNINYHTRNVYYPSSVNQVQQIIEKTKNIKCLGSRHSFSTIADSDGYLVSTSNLKSVLELDASTSSVTVEPGIKYGELATFLHSKGFALRNLASLPHISVGGACATATHGSGVNNGNLSTSVRALEIVDGLGKLHSISKDKDNDLFNGVVVNLGALGIVTKLTLDIVPDFNMSQVVYRNLPFEVLTHKLHEIMASWYSVSLFTNWSKEQINEVWIKRVHDASNTVASPSEFYGASRSDIDLHPVETQSAESVTTQRGIAGPWFERLPHFKMGFKPSTGKELQSEFFVHKDQAFEAMKAMQSLGPVISPHLFISEIRSVKSDELWMSPAYKKDSIAIHTTWHQDEKVQAELIPLVQNALRPYDPTPHWAKLSTIRGAALAKLFPRIDDFKALCQEFDPNKKFLNRYLRESIFS
jgi:xylitol oxidase